MSVSRPSAAMTAATRLLASMTASSVCAPAGLPLSALNSPLTPSMKSVTSRIIGLGMAPQARRAAMHASQFGCHRFHPAERAFRNFETLACLLLPSLLRSRACPFPLPPGPYEGCPNDDRTLRSHKEFLICELRGVGARIWHSKGTLRKGQHETTQVPGGRG